MVTFSLPNPPSTNELYIFRNGRRVKSGVYRAWILTAGKELMIQRVRPVASPVAVSFTVQTNNLRDLDNYLKCSLDLMKNHRIIQNDNMKHVRNIEIGHSPDVKGVQITLTEIEGK